MQQYAIRQHANLVHHLIEHVCLSDSQEHFISHRDYTQNQEYDSDHIVVSEAKCNRKADFVAVFHKERQRM